MYEIKVKTCYQFATKAVRQPSQLQGVRHTILYNLGSYHQPHYRDGIN